ncbi:hypothetical protein [Gluconacetobacter entanii]|uniref:hypothetical protein n=1 Tax=Gluconacetobacter entanii TaxID=108528 RepID=UPI001FC9336E|nr:hypothetical protein [Gluconacetobacter entanii]
MSVSPLARLFLIGLWNEADDNGIFQWKPLTLKMRLLPADGVDATSLLEELEGTGAIMRYEADGKAFGAVKNFRKFQRPERPKPVHAITPEVEKFVALDAKSHTCSKKNPGSVGDKTVRRHKPIGERVASEQQSFDAQTPNEHRQNIETHGPMERCKDISSLRSDITLTSFGTPAAPSSPDEDTPAPTPVAPEAKPPTPPDQRSVLFGIGSQIVCSMTGKPPRATKSLIGKWLRDVRDDCAVLNGIIQESADTRPADPIAWITAAVKARGSGRTADRTRRWALDGVDLDASAEEGWKEMGL